MTITPLVTNDTTPALAGTVDDVAATVEVKIGADTYAATNHGDGTWTLADGDITTPLAGGVYDVVVTATDAVGNGGTDATPDELEILVPQVVERHIFYNGSAWDEGIAGANDFDDLAIAIDKTALLPGVTASFANYTSYTRGINGIMVDIAGLEGRAMTAGDFEFHKGNSDYWTTWGEAPAPTSVTVRPGAGADGSDRVTLIWAEGAIQKCWLKVRVLASGSAQLASDDVFLFGNAVGESGNEATRAIVNSQDMLSALNDPHGLFNRAEITNVNDFDRDRLVISPDMLAARNNQTSPFTALPLITPEAVAPSAPLAGAEGGGEAALPSAPAGDEFGALSLAAPLPGPAPSLSADAAVGSDPLSPAPDPPLVDPAASPDATLDVLGAALPAGETAGTEVSPASAGTSLATDPLDALAVGALAGPLQN